MFDATDWRSVTSHACPLLGASHRIEFCRSRASFARVKKKKSHLSFPAEPKPHLKAGPISGVQKLPVTDRDDHGHLLKFTPSKTDLSVKTPTCCLQVEYIMDILRVPLPSSTTRCLTG